MPILSTIQFVFLSLGLVLAGSGAGFAANYGGDHIQAGPFSIGGRGTYYKPNDASGSWYGGAQIRYLLAAPVAIEASADYRRNQYNGTTVHTYPVQASFLFYLIPNSPVTLFALAGGGWYYTTVDNPGGSDTQNRFGPHAGGGVQWFMNKYWSIDATYRYVWVSKVTTGTGTLINQDFSDRGHMITAGLNLHF